MARRTTSTISSYRLSRLQVAGVIMVITMVEKWRNDKRKAQEENKRSTEWVLQEHEVLFVVDDTVRTSILTGRSNEAGNVLADIIQRRAVHNTTTTTTTTTTKGIDVYFLNHRPTEITDGATAKANASEETEEKEDEGYI